MSNNSLAVGVLAALCLVFIGADTAFGQTGVCNEHGCYVFASEVAGVANRRIRVAHGDWTSPAFTARFGSTGDIPLIGDWDPSNAVAVGTFRDGVWRLRQQSVLTSSSVLEFTFGEAGATPLLGDWDGDGQLDFGVVMGQTWHLMMSDDMSDTRSFEFGTATSTPLVGDWDGDGIATPAYVDGSVMHYRKSNALGANDTVAYEIPAIVEEENLIPITWKHDSRDVIAFTPAPCDMAVVACSGIGSGGAVVITTGPGIP